MTSLTALLALCVTAEPLPPRPVPEMISGYQMWDLAHRNGQGSSDATTSGAVGWNESSFLRAYMHCYHVSRDPYWLDKMVAHVDRILAAQHDRNGDGFLAWDDVTYSVGLVDVVRATGAEGLSLTPEKQRENVTAQGRQVTGHRYAVELPTAATVTVTDLDTKAVLLAAAPYAGQLVLDIFAGRSYPDLKAARAAKAAAPLTLSGPGRAGARFELATVAAQPVEFVVHDGMAAYPIAQFIEAVMTRADLPAGLRVKADAYAEWLWRHVYQKWARYWRAMGDAGAYTFTENITERYPGFLLPHNQYLALARAYLVLQAIDGLPHRQEYRDRATRMARYFQQHLRPALDGRAYVWNYWDPPENERAAIRAYPEDMSHATIDVGFVCEAADRGIVFGRDDVLKIARTFTDVAGHGDPQQPQAFRVDGSGKRDGKVVHDWLLTGIHDDEALRYVLAVAGSSVTGAPELALVFARRGQVSDADRAAMLAFSAKVPAMREAAAAGNLSFEVGYGHQPAGWTYNQWSAEAGQGRFEWSTEACEGQRSLALIGESGTPNLVAESIEYRVTEPTRLTIALRYKTAGAAKPFVSLIAPVPGGERQYDNSPTLPASDGWREATWSVVTQAGATSARVYLRNGGVGTVWYDDLKVTTGKP